MPAKGATTDDQADFISVLMPVYNAAPYLGIAIESILAQTHENLQLIIKDDCSSDASAQIAQGYAKKDPRVLILPTDAQNGGEVAMRNALLRAANGTYLAWMDADDYALPHRLETQLHFLKHNPQFGAVGTAIRYMDENGVLAEEDIFSSDWEVQANRPDLHCPTLLVRGDLAHETGLYRTIFNPSGGDGDWVLRFCDKHKITNLDEVLYHYRRVEGSLSSYFVPIRRIGVLAYHGARERRAGRPDPMDSMVWDEQLSFLHDNVFLSHTGLTSEEQLLALGEPLKDTPQLVTVMIPYNGEYDDLKGAIASLNAQSFANYAISICDNASAKPLTATDPIFAACSTPVSILRSDQPLSPAQVCQRLLASAQGAFAMWQRVDARARADRIQILVQHMLENPDCLGVGSGINLIDPKTGQAVRSISFPRNPVQGQNIKAAPHSFMLRLDAMPPAFEISGARDPLRSGTFLYPLGQSHKLETIEGFLLEVPMGFSSRLKSMRLYSALAGIWAQFARRYLGQYL